MQHRFRHKKDEGVLIACSACGWENAVCNKHERASKVMKYCCSLYQAYTGNVGAERTEPLLSEHNLHPQAVTAASGLCHGSPCPALGTTTRSDIR